MNALAILATAFVVAQVLITAESELRHRKTIRKNRHLRILLDREYKRRKR